MFHYLQGIVAAYNMTLNMDKIFRFFKAGEYTNTMKVYDVLDSQIFKIKIYTTVTWEKKFLYL